MPEAEAEVREAERGRWHWTSFFSSAAVGLPILVFVLGVMTGFPIAIFGFDFLIENAAIAFAVLFGLLFLVTVAGVAIIALRKQIWQRLFKYGEVELHRIGEPLGEVVRLTSERRIAEATVAASDLARFVMAHYAWIATRRWIIGAVTGFVAVIAALAGSALLFQQNQLLRVQGELMRQQTERLTEQTRMLEAQIQLGEAQRSTSIVPEILAIGADIAAETGELPVSAPAGTAASLSSRLRGRIIAATAAARPYRYLRYELDASDDEIVAATLGGREDLAGLRRELGAALEARQTQWDVEVSTLAMDSAALADRIVSPERGQILAMLHSAGILDIDQLTADGADFSFAEVRAPVLSNMSLRLGYLPYADFSRVVLNDVDFRGGRLVQARFRKARIVGGRFASIPNAEVAAPFSPNLAGTHVSTRLVGTDFGLAKLFECDFGSVLAIGARFEGAAIFVTDFAGASLDGVSFRNAILFTVGFQGVDLSTVDFDGAVALQPDFLDLLQAQAAPGSFDRGKYVLEPLGEDALATHPNVDALAELPPELLRTTFRLRRLAPVEPASTE